MYIEKNKDGKITGIYANPQDGKVLEWVDGPVEIPESYQAKRQREYPPIGDQLDAIMKWVATEGEFTVPAELKSIAMTCMSVKAKYPKTTD